MFTQYLTVHVVFGLDELTAINFAINGFASDDMPLGFVQNFNRNTDRHYEE